MQRSFASESRPTIWRKRATAARKIFLYLESSMNSGRVRFLIPIVLFAASQCARYGATGSYLSLLLLQRPASYNPVNQIQGGLITMSSANTPVAVNSVDMSRSMVLCYFRTTQSDPASVPTCELTSSTQIVVQTGGSSVNYFCAVVPCRVCRRSGGPTRKHYVCSR